jgi:hypothetical protein
MVVFRIVIPVWRLPSSVHAKLGKAGALTRKKELLPLLESAGASLQLVNMLNCDVYRNRYSGIV